MVGNSKSEENCKFGAAAAQSHAPEYATREATQRPRTIKAKKGQDKTTTQSPSTTVAINHHRHRHLSQHYRRRPSQFSLSFPLISLYRAVCVRCLSRMTTNTVSRLPTLSEVVSSKSRSPVDLFGFYVFMRDEQRSVDCTHSPPR